MNTGIIRRRRLKINIGQLVWVSVIALIMSLSQSLGQDTTVDPCSLVSRIDIEQVSGKLQGPPKSGQNGKGRVCEYVAANGNDFLDVWLYSTDNLEPFRRDAKTVKPIAGLGEEAFIHHDARFQQIQLFARKGHTAVQVILTESQGAEEKITSTARKALASLT